MKCKTAGRNGDVALKTDISKAYDKVDWSYLRGMMLKLGFHTTWVNWIMMCVESVHYMVQVNYDQVGPITPSRGLRQGDPLSPYLYIICTEGLTALIRQAERRGDLHGVKICRGRLSSLIFCLLMTAFFFSELLTLSLR